MQNNEQKWGDSLAGNRTRFCVDKCSGKRGLADVLPETCKRCNGIYSRSEAKRRALEIRLHLF